MISKPNKLRTITERGRQSLDSLLNSEGLEGCSPRVPVLGVTVYPTAQLHPLRPRERSQAVNGGLDA